MRSHVPVLAWIHIVMGALSLLGAAIAFLVLGGVAAFTASTGAPESGHAALAFGGFALILLVIVALLSLPQIILGWGLLQGASWARGLGIVMSVLSLMHPAFGLLVGIYGLVVLFDKDTIAMFEGAQQRAY